MAPDIVRVIYSLILFDVAVFKKTTHVQPQPLQATSCHTCSTKERLEKSGTRHRSTGTATEAWNDLDPSLEKASIFQPAIWELGTWDSLFPNQPYRSACGQRCFSPAICFARLSPAKNYPAKSDQPGTGEAAPLDWFQLSSAREGCTLSRFAGSRSRTRKYFSVRVWWDSVSTGHGTCRQDEDTCPTRRARQLRTPILHAVNKVMCRNLKESVPIL